jgi:hypothetical protein
MAGHIGWLYLFWRRSGSRQALAASVIDRRAIVPMVLLPSASAPLDVSLGIGRSAVGRTE